MPKNCDQNVTVTFNTQNHSFNFSPDTVYVAKDTTSVICLNLTPRSGPKFTNFSIENGGDFSWEITSDSQIQVTDQNEDAAQTEHNYKVTVEYDNQTYTSDPKIINRG
jgi:hypothetical protein